MKPLINTKALPKTTLLALLLAGCSWNAINKQGLGMMEDSSSTAPAQDEEQWETFLTLMDEADEMNEIDNFLGQHQDFVKSKHWWAKDTDYTPLHYAADQGDLEVVKALIARGAEVNAKTGEGVAPLHYAVAAGHLDVVKHLFKVLKEKYGEEHLNPRDNDGLSPLHIAARGEYEDLTKFIVAEIPDAIKTEANDGNTALHLAAYLGYTRIVDALLGSSAIDKAILMKQNSGGKTPLEVAKKEEIKKKLEARLKIV